MLRAQALIIGLSVVLSAADGPKVDAGPLKPFLDAFGPQLKSLSYTTKIQFKSPSEPELEIKSERKFIYLGGAYKMWFKPELNQSVEGKSPAELLYQGKAEYQLARFSDRVEFLNGVTGILSICTPEQMEATVPEANVLAKKTTPDHLSTLSFLAIVPKDRKTRDGLLAWTGIQDQVAIGVRLKELCGSVTVSDSKLSIAVPGEGDLKVGANSSTLTITLESIAGMAGVKAPTKIVTKTSTGQEIHAYEFEYQVVTPAGGTEPQVPLLKKSRAFLEGNKTPYMTMTIEDPVVNGKTDIAQVSIDPSLAKDIIDSRSRVRVLTK